MLNLLHAHCINVEWAGPDWAAHFKLAGETEQGISQRGPSKAHKPSQVRAGQAGQAGPNKLGWAGPNGRACQTAGPGGDTHPGQAEPNIGARLLIILKNNIILLFFCYVNYFNLLVFFFFMTSIK